jgi:hypothetical protein
VEITFDADRGLALICEARHGLFDVSLDATGSWPGAVQVDGPTLYQLATKYPGQGTELTLILETPGLSVQAGTSKLVLPCQVGRKSIKQTEMPVNRRHKGKVEANPILTHETPKGETWDFSAQVPFKRD